MTQEKTLGIVKHLGAFLKHCLLHTVGNIMFKTEKEFVLIKERIIKRKDAKRKQKLITQNTETIYSKCRGQVIRKEQGEIGFLKLDIEDCGSE